MKDPVTFFINYAISRFTGAVALIAFIVLLGLWAGVFLSLSLIAFPMTELLPPDLRHQVVHTMVLVAHGPKLTILILSCIPAGALAVLFCARTARPWLLAALGFHAAALVVTVMANAPLMITASNAHRLGGGSDPAGGLDPVLVEWDRFNDLRFGLMVLALLMALRAMQHHERRPREG